MSAPDAGTHAPSRNPTSGLSAAGKRAIDWPGKGPGR